MSDVMNQSAVMRNKQFGQKNFYAANSELHVYIEAVNRSAQSQNATARWGRQYKVVLPTTPRLQPAIKELR